MIQFFSTGLLITCELCDSGPSPIYQIPSCTVGGGNNGTVTTTSITGRSNMFESQSMCSLPSQCCPSPPRFGPILTGGLPDCFPLAFSRVLEIRYNLQVFKGFHHRVFCTVHVLMPDKCPSLNGRNQRLIRLREVADYTAKCLGQFLPEKSFTCCIQTVSWS